MSKVRINAYQVGLKFEYGNYLGLLREGRYWVRSSESIEVYELAAPFAPAFSLNILLRDEQLAEMLQVVEVGDHEIALQYEHGRLKQVLKGRRHRRISSCGRKRRRARGAC